MNYYNLPNIALHFRTYSEDGNIQGILKFRIGSEFADLNAPTIQTIKDIELTKSNDVIAGEQQIETLTLTIRDDYSNHNEGFWYKVLSGDCEIRVLLSEDGIDSFFFYGKLEQKNWDEMYVSGSTRWRIGTITFLSMLKILLESDIEDLTAEVIANKVDVDPPPEDGIDGTIRLVDIFSAMLKSSGLNSEYSPYRAYFVYDTIDFWYKVALTIYRFDEIRIPVSYSQGGVHNKICYVWESDGGLEANYSKIKEFLHDLCLSFGLYVKMEYDITNDKHLLALLQRRNTYSDPLNFGSTLVTSAIADSDELVIDGVKATNLYWTGYSYYRSYKYGIGNPPPDSYSFDIDFKVPFDRQLDNPMYSEGYWLLAPDLTPITDVWYYDHSTNGWDGGFHVYQVAPKYLYSMYLTRDDANFLTRRKKFIQTYDKVIMTNGFIPSHVYIDICQIIPIDDGLGVADYLINRVTKRLFENETEVELIRS